MRRIFHKSRSRIVNTTTGSMVSSNRIQRCVLYASKCVQSIILLNLKSYLGHSTHISGRSATQTTLLQRSKQKAKCEGLVPPSIKFAFAQLRTKIMKNKPRHLRRSVGDVRNANSRKSQKSKNFIKNYIF